MDIMELGAIGELVGGVAVIASLIYVGVQVRHNTHAVAAGTHGNMLHFSSGIESLILSDAEMADIEYRGDQQPKALSEVEWRRFAGFARMRFGSWEAAYLNYQKGTIDEEMWLAWDGFWRLLLSSPGYHRVWRESASGYAPTFQLYVEKRVLSDREGA